MESINRDLISYYRDRASEYEKIYAKPERQADLLLVGQRLQEVFRDRNVLEIACGTGYWTQRIAVTARSVLATDVNSAVIDIAKSKPCPSENVSFETADLYQLKEGGMYDCVFGGFIWSHIGLQELPRFIDRVNSLAGAGGKVVFIDNNYVEGSSLPVTDSDEHGNTYQTRALEDGSLHKVMKNFPSEDFLLGLLKGRGRGIEFVSFQYYWMLAYQVDDCAYQPRQS